MVTAELFYLHAKCPTKQDYCCWVYLKSSVNYGLSINGQFVSNAEAADDANGISFELPDVNSHYLHLFLISVRPLFMTVPAIWGMHSSLYNWTMIKGKSDCNQQPKIEKLLILWC